MTKEKTLYQRIDAWGKDGGAWLFQCFCFGAVFYMNSGPDGSYRTMWAVMFGFALGGFANTPMVKRFFGRET